MIRPVRQLTIKSLLFLVPLVAGLAVGLRKVIEGASFDYSTINEDKEAIPLAIAIWLLPAGLPFVVRSQRRVFLLALCGVYAIQCSIVFDFLDPPYSLLLAYLWLPVGAGKAGFESPIIVFWLQGFLYALLGPLFAMTCHLREESPAVTR